MSVEARVRCYLAAAVVLVSLAHAGRTTPRYHIEDISAVDLFQVYLPVDPVISDSGQVAFASDSGVYRFTDSAGVQRLSTASGAVVKGINVHGDVIGWIPYRPSADSAFLYSDSQGLQQLRDIVPMGLNDSGTIVGFNPTGAIRRTPLGEIQALWSGGSATGVNNADSVTGHTDANPVVWSDAGGLVSLENPYQFASGLSINARSEVAGLLDPGGPTHPAMWTSTGHLIDLLPADAAARHYANAQNSYALRINDAGMVAGYYDAWDTQIGTHLAPFLYTQDAGFIDLQTAIDNPLGWSLYAATGLNNAGQVVGWGTYRGKPHVFRLTPAGGPVPEPGTILLLAGGLTAVLTGRKSARRQAASR